VGFGWSLFEGEVSGAFAGNINESRVEGEFPRRSSGCGRFTRISGQVSANICSIRQISGEAHLGLEPDGFPSRALQRLPSILMIGLTLLN
jgi:hypothetical protein